MKRIKRSVSQNVVSSRQKLFQHNQDQIYQKTIKKSIPDKHPPKTEIQSYQYLIEVLEEMVQNACPNNLIDKYQKLKLNTFSNMKLENLDPLPIFHMIVQLFINFNKESSSILNSIVQHPESQQNIQLLNNLDTNIQSSLQNIISRSDHFQSEDQYLKNIIQDNLSEFISTTSQYKQTISQIQDIFIQQNEELFIQNQTLNTLKDTLENIQQQQSELKQQQQNQKEFETPENQQNIYSLSQSQQEQDGEILNQTVQMLQYENDQLKSKVQVLQDTILKQKLDKIQQNGPSSQFNSQLTQFSQDYMNIIEQNQQGRIGSNLNSHFTSQNNNLKSQVNSVQQNKDQFITDFQVMFYPLKEKYSKLYKQFIIQQGKQNILDQQFQLLYFVNHLIEIFENDNQCLNEQLNDILDQQHQQQQQKQQEEQYYQQQGEQQQQKQQEEEQFEIYQIKQQNRKQKQQNETYNLQFQQQHFQDSRSQHNYNQNNNSISNNNNGYFQQKNNLADNYSTDQEIEAIQDQIKSEIKKSQDFYQQFENKKFEISDRLQYLGKKVQETSTLFTEENDNNNYVLDTSF